MDICNLQNICKIGFCIFEIGASACFECKYLITQRRDAQKLKKFVDYPTTSFFCSLMILDSVFWKCFEMSKKKKCTLTSSRTD